jgi:hypothetical protein
MAAVERPLFGFAMPSPVSICSYADLGLRHLYQHDGQRFIPAARPSGQVSLVGRTAVFSAINERGSQAFT